MAIMAMVQALQGNKRMVVDLACSVCSVYSMHSKVDVVDAHSRNAEVCC